VLGRIPSLAGIDISSQYRRGDNRHSVSSIDKLKRLGWKPKRGMDEILGDFLEWVESSGGIPASLPDPADEMRAAGVLLSATN
jgi:nucleoside-diphosphate-sugar epimerase